MSAKPVPTSESTAPALLRAQATNDTLKLRPWGGTRLWRGRGLQHPQRGRPLGEAWEFSTLQEGESYSCDQPLRQILGHPLPFLAKLVDVQRPLSVQIHPSPQGSAPGKEEAWIVLDAGQDAQILAGLRPGIDRQAFADALENAQSREGEQDAVFECLQPHKVRPGSVVLIPPRTVHTIPSEVFIAEIQDPFDITYRFFDYGSSRQIHRDLAFDALDPQSQPIVWHPAPGFSQHTLQGQRVRVCAYESGSHIVSWSTGERLLVSVRASCEIQYEGQSESLEAGEMRLATRGPLTLQVPTQGIAIVAWLDEVTSR